MTDRTPPDAANNDGDNNDSVRGPFQAWLNAGSALGDIVGDFAGRFQEDRKHDEPEHGEHALRDPVDDQETVLGKFRAATTEAREAFKQAEGTEELKSASAQFGGRAEGIFRDVAGSVTRAADGTKDSTSVGEARAAFSDAVASVRTSYDEAVEKLRSDNTDGSSDSDNSTIDNLRGYLDDLVGRARTAVGGNGASENTDADSDEKADIIEGEVVSEKTTDKPKNQDS